MKITLTHHETLCFAHERLHRLLGKDIDLDFESSPPYNGAEKITSANKIELVKFARQLVADALTGIIIPAKDADGSPFFGLADAKHYVEKYFNFPN